LLSCHRHKTEQGKISKAGLVHSALFVCAASFYAKEGKSWSNASKVALMEVKRQVENALNVTAREFGEMELGRPLIALFNVLSVAIVGIGSVNRQFYQPIKTSVLSVKCAPL
jgi:hypothetical protein